MSDEERIRAMMADGEALHAAFEVIITKRPGSHGSEFPRFRTTVRGLLTGITVERDGVVPQWDIMRAVIEGSKQLRAEGIVCPIEPSPYSSDGSTAGRPDPRTRET